MSLYVFTVLQILASLNNYLPTWFWIQEISINLGSYWLVAHLLTIAAFLCLRRSARWWKTFCFVLAFFSYGYLRQISTFYIPLDRLSVEPGPNHLRVMFANVFADNRRSLDLRQTIEKENPDLVGLAEVDKRWGRELNLGAVYPHRVEIFRDDYFGIALYSRFPLDEATITSLGPELPPVVVTKIRPAVDLTIDLVLYHAMQPLSPESFYPNRVMVRRLSTPLRHSSNSILVLGDFNADIYSGLYKRFREAATLRDAMEGYGYIRTWHALTPLARLSLDHILYGGQLRVLNFERLTEFGSDHFPIIADFSW